MLRECIECGDAIPEHKRSNAKLCGSHSCKTSALRRWRSENARNWYWDNRERALAGMRQRRSGASPEQYAAALVSQDGRCAICGTHQDELKRALSADHDHKRGDFLGLLCGRCNTGLGMFGDDINKLRAAVAYYEERGRS